MFEEIPFVVGFFVVSIVVSYLFFRIEFKPIKIAVQVVAVVGVIVHEISHILMCLVTHTKIDSVVLLKKVENRGLSNKVYGGEVNIQSGPRLCFLQALVVGLAPLFISFWIFFLLLHEFYNPNTTEILAALYIFIMISLFLGSAPSKGDWSQIGSAFAYDIEYTLYQLFLVAISVISVWYIVATLQIPVIHEIINYIFIFIGYYLLKYSFKGVYRGVNRIFKKLSLPRYRSNKRLRRRSLWHRMEEPNERDVQW